MPKWTEANVPDQSGRVALITGANSGIGWDAARVLAGRGATVLLACRSAERGSEAVARIAALSPQADLQFLALDLSDLDSTRRAAEQVQKEHTRLDLLINNAGLMATPLGRTAQGFEMQFGVNHLGHFALTGLLLPLLLATPESRVVSVSSTGHRPGHIDLADLNWNTRAYKPWAAYFQSKLANLLFTYELQRKLAAAGRSTAALAAHPGGSRTNLGHQNPGGIVNRLLETMRPLIERFVLQESAMGALPTLRAAVDPEARGGEYYGPDGFSEQTGHPVRVDSSKRSKDAEVARKLWRASEELTGVDFVFDSK
jgi:NAD(P)-dependent dehydrogenase (short-subunit alcohol dehydrogenase family)